MYVDVIDVNDVTVTGFASAPGGGSTIPHLTKGGQDVIILGTDFGGVNEAVGARKVSATYGQWDPAANVGAGGWATRYEATACTVVEPNTRIKCTTAAGVGSNLRWTVTVFPAAGQTAMPDGKASWTSPPSTDTTAYVAPVVTGVSTDCSAVPTAGFPLLVSWRRSRWSCR